MVRADTTAPVVNDEEKHARATTQVHKVARGGYSFGVGTLAFWARCNSATTLFAGARHVGVIPDFLTVARWTLRERGHGWGNSHHPSGTASALLGNSRTQEDPRPPRTCLEATPETILASSSHETAFSDWLIVVNGFRFVGSESVSQALAGAERIKPVREAQIDVDLFGLPLHVHFLARGVVREQFAASWTWRRELHLVRARSRSHGWIATKYGHRFVIGYWEKPLVSF